MPWDTPPQFFLTGNTAGTTHVYGPAYTLSGGPNITLSGSGQQIVISGGAGGPGGGLGGIAANGSTQTAGTVGFVNSNGLSWGFLTGTNSTQISGSYTVPNVPAQTAYSFADSNGVSWGTNGSTVTATVKTNYLTSQSNQALSAGNGSFTFQTATFADSNGVSWSTGTQGVFATVQTNYLTTARRSTDAVGLNTAQTAVTWTVNSSGISIDAGAYLTTARRSTDAIGLNTAQTNVTWTANSSGLSLDASGYAGTVTGATNCSVTANTSGVSVNVNTAPNVSYWESPRVDGLVSFSATSNSISVQRIFIPANLSATRAEFVMNISGSSSGAASMRFNLGIYTMNHSTLSSVSSTSRGLSFQSTSAISYTAVSGPRSFSIPLGAWNFAPGEYFVAFNYGMTTASSNTNFVMFLGASNAAVVSGWETGAFANITDVYRSGMVNNVANSVLAATMQLSGMTMTGASEPLQPWVGFYGTF